MRYLLDTTVFLDHAMGRYGASELLERLFSETGDLYTCDAVVAEALSKGPDEELRAIERLIDALEFVATTPEAARWAGACRRRRNRTSRRHLGDALLAGVAWDLDATIVTRNPRDFAGLGLHVLTYGPVTTA